MSKDLKKEIIEKSKEFLAVSNIAGRSTDDAMRLCYKNAREMISGQIGISNNKSHQESILSQLGKLILSAKDKHLERTGKKLRRLEWGSDFPSDDPEGLYIGKWSVSDCDKSNPGYIGFKKVRVFSPKGWVERICHPDALDHTKSKLIDMIKFSVRTKPFFIESEV